jgi:TRAP-type mannitol/chloroaromatic compound transport system permease small subunit
MALRILDFLRTLNRWIALAIGLGLLGCVGYILLEIVLRRSGQSLGGTTEITGYVMAIATAWGMGYALLELAHVRIEILRGRMGRWGRAVIDLAAMLATASVVSLIAWRAWPVLERSIQNNSRANTVLETPLWIPQSLWFAGWAWFALMAVAVSLIAISLMLQGRLEQVESTIGLYPETHDDTERTA